MSAFNILIRTKTTLRPRGSNLRHRIHRNLAALLFGPVITRAFDDRRREIPVFDARVIHHTHPTLYRSPPADRPLP